MAGCCLGQALEPESKLGETQYFLDDGKLWALDSSRGSLRRIELDPEKFTSKPTELISHATGLLLKGEGQYVLLSPGVEPKYVSPPGDLKVWGDSLIGLNQSSGEVTKLGADGRFEVLWPDVSNFEVLDKTRLLLFKKDGSRELHHVDGSYSDSVPGESAPAEVELTQSREKLLFWSKDSTVLSAMGGVGFAPDPLSSPPVRGVKSLGDGSFVLALEENLIHLTINGQARELPPLAILASDKFEQASFAPVADGIGVAGFGELQYIPVAGEPTGRTLQGQVVKNVLRASVKNSGRAFALTESEEEENKMDDWGNPILSLKPKNPAIEEPETLKLRSSQLWFTKSNGDWISVFSEDRTRQVGPLQIVGDTLVLATQTEPPNSPGVNKGVNRKYPFPNVVLRGFDVKTGRQRWVNQLERSQSPSVARMPEEWATEDGHIFYTSQENRLIKLGVQDGQVLSASEPLPLDDSKPRFLKKGDGLSLLAADRTNRNLLDFDASGQLVKKHRLSTIFNHQRWLNLIGVLAICLALIIYIYVAGKKSLYIRRIAGLEALDEAVGRATEMGKPVLYVTGLADVDDIQTLAALSILSHVARKTAEYDSSILATTSRSVTFSAAQEVVRDAFTVVGRPDSFQADSVRYISDDQFGYAAGVDGLMLREEPAANFYMGKFYAESLIFAETGHATGAIQIAGTAQPNQLPFFVAACDYTLIGEELFAASAYLSGEPLQVGSLRGQDVGKAIVMILLVVFAVDATTGGHLQKFFSSLLGGAS